MKRLLQAPFRCVEFDLGKRSPPSDRSAAVNFPLARTSPTMSSVIAGVIVLMPTSPS
jgi:hypothetical protein